jgi:ABC-type antimicrobial peptide transport system permease subunit
VKNETERARLFFGGNYDNGSILDYFNTDKLQNIIYSKRTFLMSLSLLMLIALINILNFSYNWFRKNARNFSILVLLGYNTRKIVQILLLAFIFMIIPSFIIAGILTMSLDSILSNVFFINFKFKIENFYAGCIFSIVLLFICAAINYFYILIADLSKELRR